MTTTLLWSLRYRQLIDELILLFPESGKDPFVIDELKKLSEFLKGEKIDTTTFQLFTHIACEFKNPNGVMLN